MSRAVAVQVIMHAVNVQAHICGQLVLERDIQRLALGHLERHVLVGGTPSVHAFAEEVAEAEGGDELPPHKATKIIGEVLAEIDARPS